MFTKEEIKKIITTGLLIGIAIVVYHIADNFIQVLTFIGGIFNVFSPITTGFVIAYIVNIPMKSIEKVAFQKRKLKPSLKRIFSLLITVMIGAIFFMIIFSFALPQFVESVTQLKDQIPGYATSLGEFLQKQFTQLNVSEDIILQAQDIWQNFLDTMAGTLLNIANTTLSSISGFISGVFNAILSAVLAIYMLLSKEKLSKTFNKILLAFTPEKFSKGLKKYMAIINNSFENFIRGQMLEAVVLGFVCYIGMVIFGFEYALLISVLVGITNIIPLFGPYIGAVPSFLLLLMVNPVHALWFILYVGILQQVESNLIYPRVVGTSVGLSGFWIIVAVVVGNSLFGILGILLGIPLLSSMYVIVKEIAEKRLKQKKIRI